MTYVYGAGNGKYQSAAEAEAHMVEIVVPVWHLQSDGTKVASKAYLQVNASLASIYQAIFQRLREVPDLRCRLLLVAYRRALAGHRS